MRATARRSSFLRCVPSCTRMVNNPSRAVPSARRTSGQSSSPSAAPVFSTPGAASTISREISPPSSSSFFSERASRRNSAARRLSIRTGADCGACSTASETCTLPRDTRFKTSSRTRGSSHARSREVANVTSHCLRLTEKHSATTRRLPATVVPRPWPVMLFIGRD